MTKSLIAIHTIHRPGRKKGETDIVVPGTHFVANSAEEAEFLLSSGAAKLNEQAEKPKRSRKKKVEKAANEAPAGEANGVPAEEAPADEGDEVL